MAVGEGDSSRRSLVSRAVESWTSSFVDLSGRNRLLYFTMSTLGTLDLTPGMGPDPAPEVVSRLLTGTQVELKALFPDRERRLDATKRCRAVAGKARELFEERGLAALYVTYGVARWDEKTSRALPAAPVLMLPLMLDPISPVGDEWWLQLSGTIELNPSLLQKVSRDFGVDLDEDELVGDTDAVPGDLDAVLERIRTAATGVSGFAIDPGVVVGTFTYRKLPMVRDLEENLEAAIGHDIVAALAGDREAQAAIRTRSQVVDIETVAKLDPRDEHIVVDADSTQSQAIESVAAGADLVIHGPPGTGKSQTIANLIATLAADGRSVLFVAEKRAAVDAVLRRLEAVGLGDLVMDLHGKRVSRRAIAAALRDALERPSAEAVDADDTEELHRQLVQRRDDLDTHVSVLHRPHAPWDATIYEAEVGVREDAPQYNATLRIESETLRRLSKDAIDRACQLTRELAELSRTLDEDSPWAHVDEGTIGGDRALDAAIGLRNGDLPRTRSAVERLAAVHGLPPATTIDGAAAQVAALDRLRGTLRRFRPEVFEGPEPDGQRIRSLARPGTDLAGYEATWLRRIRDDRSWWLSQGATVPDPVSPEALSEATKEIAKLETAVAAVHERVPVVDRHLDFESLAEVLDRLVASSDDRVAFARLREVRRELDELGLGDLVGRFITDGAVAGNAAAALLHAWWASVRDQIRAQDISLEAPWQVVAAGADEFVALDRQHIAHNPSRVRAAVDAHRRRIESEHADEATFVRWEANKSSRHEPPQRLFAEAPRMMTALKPCWVASPLEVASLFPGDRPTFDVVVFDEASQVPPADAVPAILRGRRVVVAGDRQQLPPTDFFEVATDPDDGDVSGTAGFDSVLDLLQALVPSIVLGWHYRSQNQRLIAFSNDQFYGGALTTFPGPERAPGVRLVLVPGAGELDPDDLAQAEVDKVVDLVVDHARERPERSLGVIAFGIGQASRIDDTLRRRLADEPEVQPFFAAGRPEPFFVKNLERVQGDERDDVIISVGYSRRNDDGSLRHAFGPINAQGGERRLNVAITRARVTVAVVSTFTADDMSPEKSAKGGPKVLREYLAFAGAEPMVGASRAAERDLDAYESDLAVALSTSGWSVEPKVGEGRDRVTFALRGEGGSSIAVDTDGPNYATDRTARDRDRLRPEHLVRLGWRFHRLWLAQWEQMGASAVPRLAEREEAT